jgi:hydrogenase maturation protein HypF
VQGVGFRPTVYRLASGARLGGFVRNDSEGVWIEIEGESEALAGFAEALRREAPPLARIDSIEVIAIPAQGDREFCVLESTQSATTRAILPADAGTCDACLRELFDPFDRRYRYPFINCTDCGPRFTIARDVPYDRANTTMAAFAMCARCRAEYDDPADRRFHAEPNACPICGPRLTLLGPNGCIAVGDAAATLAIRRLDAGAIVAVKGLGGYQLAVDATNGAAVARLRERKCRPDKPFALMARDLEVVESVARADDIASSALRSPARPIVLLPRRPSAVAHEVAPGLGELGIMLPATPLHHLLFDRGPSLLVMTSGNLAEEPIAKDDDRALALLGPIADVILAHDRPIHTRADDSVVRVIAREVRPLRRARGYAPDPVSLGVDGPCILAVGAQRKNTVCVTRGSEAYLSQHIGDLDVLEAQACFDDVIHKLTGLLGVEPSVVAHDLHPDYVSTRRASESPIRRVAVQHHHAHIAACMAEHRRSQVVLGVAFDGSGCGPAGDLWGGEILLTDLAGFRRLGHLRLLALPGGEAAVREPWRVALAALHDAGLPLDAMARIEAARRDAIGRLLERDVACPRSTGAGRWFDAAASIIGVRDAITYEGQAAVELEALAARETGAEPYPYSFEEGVQGAPFVIDLRPTVRALAADVRAAERPSRMAARFHATVAHIVAGACRRARDQHDIRTVALSGGCFQNRLLVEQTQAMLNADGFEVLVHRRVPPNDGGVALGQAAVAAALLRRERS